jgi:arylsulfatase A-like enzyme
MKSFRLPCLFVLALSITESGLAAEKPNIVLVMADDQGWGQTSYNNHPTLKTPNIDAMASSGIRFNRFYAAGPVCSPTRASVLTGRSPVRTGVPSHGHNLCLQEKTLPQALKQAGYTTAHFGKWHLNGVRGAGVPILGDDANHPGRYGFDEWLSVTNYFDLNPLLSRKGQFEDFNGDSSDVVVAESLEFMAQQRKQGPFLAVIWYGSPHSPMRALDDDAKNLPKGTLGNHLGELVAIDRSIGTLRQGLRKLEIERDTLVWYCSDNGGLKTDPHACGNLRGHKGSVFEGGIRVPSIVEWPDHIQPTVTDFPASTMDIMPTIVDLLDLPDDTQLAVRDGESLVPLFQGDPPMRQRPIPFYYQNAAALVDGDYKLLSTNIRKDNEWTLYNLKDDVGETNDLTNQLPERFQQMKSRAIAGIASMEASATGSDYPEQTVLQTPRREFWYTMKAYQPHLEAFFKRPEYSGLENKVPDSSKTEAQPKPTRRRKKFK